MSRPITTMLAALVTTAAVAAVAVPAASRRTAAASASTARARLPRARSSSSAREDSGIEVEFEVDQNRNGVPWQVTLRRNGSVVASTTVRTHAPSGSFSLNRVVAGTAGTDRIVAVAKSPTGATCTAAASL